MTNKLISERSDGSVPGLLCWDVSRFGIQSKFLFAGISLRKFIPDLINRVLQVYGLDELQPQYDLAPVWLHIDKAIPLGLVVNEVVTNCCKYAFRDQPNPVLHVAAHQKSDLIFIQIADNGPGFTLK